MLKKYVSDLETPIFYVAGLPEMTAAMQKMLKDAGVKEDHVKAEEFTGFNLNEIQNARAHSWKRHILIIAIILVVVIVAIGHVAAASAISDMVSLKNPLVYLMIAVMLLILPLKFWHIRNAMRSGIKKSHL